MQVGRRFSLHRHCEERSDDASHGAIVRLGAVVKVFGLAARRSPWIASRRSQ
jgi:hypothetical protein